uniref:mitogen-activated protein kinase n=1 Tax=Daucus carota subsp. sativus TaxID=79200 RepID=A0A162ACT1_DAUCS
MQQDQRKKSPTEAADFFSEYGDASRYRILELLRALKYIHTANVYHRDLKPKNILANANCKLKICDFGLARVAFNDTPTTIFWTGPCENINAAALTLLFTDYVATRWYRAPELCGSFFSKYTAAIDIWSIGCIFAEVLTGKPLFPGKNVVHQLDLMTDLLGSPSMETISRVRNEKARRYLTSMRKKQPVPFAQKFPNADPLALRLLERLLAFDPKDRPTAAQALADPYFKGLTKADREPSSQQISRMEFEFERRRVTKEDIRELIFREILEYHPSLLKDYLNGTESTNFLYPRHVCFYAVDQFRKQFAHLEESSDKSGPVIPLERKHASLPRSTVVHSNSIPPKEQPVDMALRNMQLTEASCNKQFRYGDGIPVKSSRTSQVPNKMPPAKPGRVVGPLPPYENGNLFAQPYDPRTLVRNGAIPPQAVQPIGPPAYCYRQDGTVNQERVVGREREPSSQQKNIPESSIGAKLAPEIAINIDPNPFYMTRVGLPKMEHVEGRISNAASAHRKVGAVQYGMSRMY